MGEVVKLDSFALAKPDATGALEVLRQNAGDRGLTQFDLDKIKVPSGEGLTWSLPTLEGEKAVPDFNAIILSWYDARRYWHKAFGVGGNTPPDCRSDDGFTGIGEPGGSCVTCPYAEFGSAERGRGQACKQVRALFLMRQDEILPAVLLLPPTSLGDCKKFFLRLASRTIPYYGIITGFGLRRASNADGTDYARVELKMEARLSAEELTKLEEIRKQLPAFEASRLSGSDFAGESREPDYGTTEA